jgi:hypothetical protein
MEPNVAHSVVAYAGEYKQSIIVQVHGISIRGLGLIITISVLEIWNR